MNSLAIGMFADVILSTIFGAVKLKPKSGLTAEVACLFYFFFCVGRNSVQVL